MIIRSKGKVNNKNTSMESRLCAHVLCMYSDSILSGNVEKKCTRKGQIISVKVLIILNDFIPNAMDMK
jgi:hypothetical protein